MRRVAELATAGGVEKAPTHPYVGSRLSCGCPSRGVRRIHEALPQIRLLVLTAHEEEEYVLPLVRAGASGYLIKDSAVAELLAAVRALYAGQGYFCPSAARALAEHYRHPGRKDDPYAALSPREREVFSS